MAKGKKEQEFIAAYNKYFDAIYRHCYFSILNKEIAEDLAQETFIKTWKYIADGKIIRDIKPFLYRVATNLIIDYSRKRKPVPLDDIKENTISIRPNNRGNGEIIDKIETKEIIGVLEGLADPYRKVVIMRYIDEFTPKEIAEILDLSANVVSVRIHIGLKKLRKILKEKYHHYEH